MKRRFRSSALAVLLGAALVIPLSAQAPARFFDAAAPPHGKPRLTVFYPSVGTLKALLALKAQGWLPDLEVVGVHHANERTDYAAAERFVKEERLDWIRFHTVAADLGPDTLFKKNAASDELEKIFGLSSGLIFFGGPDIPPALFGEKTGLLTVIDDPWRHYLELTAVFHLLGGSQDPAFRGYLEKRPDFPVLGICLGLQTLNVGAGGTMIQDIWSDVYGLKTFEDAVGLGQAAWHSNPHRRIAPQEKNLLPYMLHPVRFEARSRIAAALGLKAGDRPFVMSAHHQAAGRIGRGLRVAAVSLDGRVIEALEHEKYPHVLGLQFHPEFPMLWESKPRFRLAPGDRELFGCRAYLEARPPSFAFHRRLWAWFLDALH